MNAKLHCEVKNSFNKAAQYYDAHAFTQNIIGQRLLDRLKLITTPFHNILDAGCGTGHFAQALKTQYPKSHVVGIDLAYSMVQQAIQKKSHWLQRKPHMINGNIVCLPFKNSSFDLVFCNLVVHWTNITETFAEFKRVLKPEGTLLFTLPGPDTLCELSQAYKAVDQFAHINPFHDMHDVGDALQKLQFHNAVVDMEKICFEYESVWAILKDLKMTGVRNIHPQRRSHITPKTQIDQLVKVYPKNSAHKHPMTFEVVYGHATCPYKKLSENLSSIPLNVI